MLLRSLSFLLSMLVAEVAPAGMVQLLFPDTNYTAGNPFTFSVEMPAATSLGAYQIDILLSGTTGTAGVDFSVDLAATDATSSGYVFPSAEFYSDALNLDSSTVQRLTLTDFDFAGVDVVPGINSTVANVFVNTLPTYTGEISISVDAAALILDTPDLMPTPIAEFATIQSDTFAAAPVTVTATAVPEPSTMVLCAVAGTAFLASRRRRKSDKS